MYFSRSSTFLMALVLSVLEFSQGFTIKMVNKTGDHAIRRHDYRLANFKSDNPPYEIRKPVTHYIYDDSENNNTIKANKCKNGARSSTGCIQVISKKEGSKFKTHNINNDSNKAIDANATIHTTKFQNQNNVQNGIFLSSEIKDKAHNTSQFMDKGFLRMENCTETINENKKLMNEALIKTNNNKSNKMINLLDALNKMLVALDNLLALTTNSTKDVDGNKTINISRTVNTKVLGLSHNKEAVSEGKTQSPNSVTSKLSAIPVPLRTNVIVDSVNKIDSPSSSIRFPLTNFTLSNDEVEDTEKEIDNAIENILKSGIQHDHNEQQQVINDDSDSTSKIHTMIADTESSRLYDWCIRIIKAEKAGDKNKFNALLKSNIAFSNHFGFLQTKRPGFKIRKLVPRLQSDEEKMTNFINGVLDCIGFVNTMQSIYHPRQS